MKYVLPFTFAAILSLSLVACDDAGGANEISWYTNVDAARAEAKKTKKMIVIDAFTEWCHWCDKLDEVTYADSNVIHDFNASFVGLKINPEVDMRGKAFLTNYPPITGFPTTFFLESDGTLIKTVSGFLEPPQMLEELAYATNVPFLRARYQDEYEKGDTASGMLLLELYDNAGSTEKADALRKTLIATISEDYKKGDTESGRQLLQLFLQAKEMEEAEALMNNLRNEKQLTDDETGLYYLIFIDHYMQSREYTNALHYTKRIQSELPGTDTYYRSIYVHAVALYFQKKVGEALSYLDTYIEDESVPVQWKEYYRQVGSEIRTESGGDTSTN